MTRVTDEEIDDAMRTVDAKHNDWFMHQLEHSLTYDQGHRASLRAQLLALTAAAEEQARISLVTCRALADTFSKRRQEAQEAAERDRALVHLLRFISVEAPSS